MDIKIIYNKDFTKRIYLQDQIEQNIIKIKNLTIEGNIYKSYSHLQFYLRYKFFFISNIIKYHLEHYDIFKIK